MSLSKKLSLYILMLVVVIFAMIGTVVESYNNRRAEEQVLLYTNSLVDNVVSSLEARMLESERQVGEYLPTIERNIADTTSINRILLQMISGDSLIVGGSVTYVPGYLGDGRDSLYMEYVAREGARKYDEWRVNTDSYDYTALKWFTDPVREKRPMWSDPYFDEGAGDIFMTTYTHPVYDTGNRLCAVVTVDLSIHDLLNKMEEIRPVSDSRTIILTANGSLIGRRGSVFVVNSETLPDSLPAPDRHAFKRIIAGDLPTSKHIEFDYEGTRMIVVSAPVPHTDWSVCCVYKYDNVVAIFGNLTWLVVVILVCGMVALIILIHALIVYNMKPLTRLTETANVISEGNLDAYIGMMDAQDEIGRLNNAFLKMKLSLKEQMERLEATTRAKQQIDSEIQIARDIQQSLVPYDFSLSDADSATSLYAILRPAREVGGDLYDSFICNGKLFFAVGDVSGKGVPAALFMGMTVTVFRLTAKNEEAPERIVSAINKALSHSNCTNTFVTMLVGVLDLATGRLTFCNAGHNPPAIGRGAEASFMQMREKNIPVGLFEDYAFLQETVCLKPGDRLVVYTDGVTEAETKDKRQFGDERLLEAIEKSSGAGASDTVRMISADIARFTRGAEQSDDITLLCLEFRDPSGIILKNDLSEIARLPEFIEAVAEKHSIDAATATSLNLALEEALVNVIDYAYPEGVKGEIRLRFEYSEDSGELTFTIEDEGQPFDPTSVAEVDTAAGIDDRKVGGLGIHLYKRIMDKVEYHRRERRNVLILTKLIPTQK